MNTRSLWAVPLALSLAGAAPAQTPAPVIHRYAAGASGATSAARAATTAGS